jgi:calcineurin-like phosphoesterase family protein
MDWFTADTHFGHSNILKYCNRNPWMTEAEIKAVAEEKAAYAAGENYPKVRISRESTEAMDADLIANINERVDEDDVLWHLGDFCFGSGNSLEIARRYRQRINCKNIIIVWGNHDRYEIGPVFNRSYDLHMVRHASGQRIVLCHYAMAVWEGSHKGNWQLFGHSHGTLNPWVDTHMPTAKMLDVGVDNAAKICGSYRPLSFNEIKVLMDAKIGTKVDHHGE